MMRAPRHTPRACRPGAARWPHRAKRARPAGIRRWALANANALDRWRSARGHAGCAAGRDPPTCRSRRARWPTTPGHVRIGPAVRRAPRRAGAARKHSARGPPPRRGLLLAARSAPDSAPRRRGSPPDSRLASEHRHARHSSSERDGRPWFRRAGSAKKDPSAGVPEAWVRSNPGTTRRRSTRAEHAVATAFGSSPGRARWSALDASRCGQPPKQRRQPLVPRERERRQRGGAQRRRRARIESKDAASRGRAAA
jgi:hypothetical protein